MRKLIKLKFNSESNFKLMRLILFILLSATVSGFIKNPNMKLTLKKRQRSAANNEEGYIPMPPTAEAIYSLKTEGFTYLESLCALVQEQNNETKALEYLQNKTINNNK